MSLQVNPIQFFFFLISVFNDINIRLFEMLAFNQQRCHSVHVATWNDLQNMQTFLSPFKLFV